LGVSFVFYKKEVTGLVGIPGPHGISKVLFYYLLYQWAYMTVSIRKYIIKVPTVEPPTAAMTGTLGTKGGVFLPFQALRSTDSV